MQSGSSGWVAELSLKAPFLHISLNFKVPHFTTPVGGRLSVLKAGALEGICQGGGGGSF